MTEPLRLQKYLAQCGVCSRRKAEELIARGRVKVDGIVVTEMGVKVTPGLSKIRCHGKAVEDKEKHVYFLLNKPKGYVTTLADPQGRPIVTSLIKGSTARLFPVGRLDLDTEGALILTNDGEFAQRVQHPSNETNKTYEALIRGHIKHGDIVQLEKGILLENKPTAPASVSIVSKHGKNHLIRITIHEGRKRQVKKMFSHFGHPVLTLKRTAYGKLYLGKLPLAKYRTLSLDELKKVFL